MAIVHIMGCFGKTTHMRNFTILYEFGEKRITIKRNKDGYVRFRFDDKLKSEILKLMDEVAGRKQVHTMGYQDEWLLLEAGDDVDEMEHRQPTEEFLFYQEVSNGNLDAVRENCQQERFLDTEGVGVLSRDPVTNLKYHFVITTAMITRLCRQKGMELEQAFRMSDFYIQKLDDIHTVQGVRSLHDEMVLDYAEKMRKLRRSDTNSKHINACKDYIYSHIKERITIEDLSDELGVSASYLSRLFKKETGDSVSAYIRRQKIEKAKNLLRYSDYAIIDIANRLSFSSQSHFIQQFREIAGVTPKKYRDTNYMAQWEIEGIGEKKEMGPAGGQ